MRLRRWTAVQPQIPIARPGSRRGERTRAISRWLASCSHRFSGGLASPSARPECWRTFDVDKYCSVPQPYPYSARISKLGEPRLSEACPQNTMSWQSW